MFFSYLFWEGASCSYSSEVRLVSWDGSARWLLLRSYDAPRAVCLYGLKEDLPPTREKCSDLPLQPYFPPKYWILPFLFQTWTFVLERRNDKSIPNQFQTVFQTKNLNLKQPKSINNFKPKGSKTMIPSGAAKTCPAQKFRLNSFSMLSWSQLSVTSAPSA